MQKTDTFYSKTYSPKLQLSLIIIPCRLIIGDFNILLTEMEQN